MKFEPLSKLEKRDTLTSKKKKIDDNTVAVFFTYKSICSNPDVRIQTDGP